MLQYFIHIFSSNKDQCYNILSAFLDKIKINVTISLIKIKLMLQYFIDLFN